MCNLLFRIDGINIGLGSHLEATFLRVPRLVCTGTLTQRLLKCFILKVCVLKQHCFNARNGF